MIALHNICMAIEEHEGEAKGHGEPSHGLPSTCIITSRIGTTRDVAWGSITR